ncbi:hypothetical protein [Peptacetobacter sp.]|uniref:hypothetical protein n=1 Tax=Peptacetobacter sp. TaxID=2991975 RepID=UPI0026027D66|nr:hypothetical protein [Peptacetobacter sp.]
MKKIIKLILPLLFILIMTTGCSTSTKSPEKLLTKPNYNEEKALLNTGISKILYQNVNLVFPENVKETGKINYVDLDEDGKNEIVAFQKKEKINSDSKVGFLVLKEENDSYSFLEDGMILEKGDKIEYADFYDLDIDGHKEIIMQYKNPEGISKIKVYSFKNNKVELKYRLNDVFNKNTVIEKGEDNTNTVQGIENKKIKISYIDEDNSLDMVILGYNPNNRDLKVSLLKFNKENVVVKDVKTITDVNGISEAYLSVGNISSQEKGLILDLPIGKEGIVGTEVLMIKDSKFITVASCKSPNMQKAYYVPISDINNDNIIDIPSISANSSSFIDKAYAYITYYQWDGKLNNDSNMYVIAQRYYNYQYNFKFCIPKNLYTVLSTEQRYESDKVIIKFKITDKNTGKSNVMFTIVVKPKVGNIDDKQGLNKAKTPIQILDNEDYIYYMLVNDKKLMKKYNVNESDLKKCFSSAYEK